MPVNLALERGRAYLLSLQREDGHWCAELEGDTILESEYILLMFFLGRLGEAKIAKAGQHLREVQLAEGGWGKFPGGGPDVNSTVKAYLALKLLGDSTEAPHMTAARRVARRLGGLEACNSFTRIYLAIFGQYPWSRCPAVPPEFVLLPRWVPFNIYEISAWSRAIVVPLSIICALRPRCEVPAGCGIAELGRECAAARDDPSESLRGATWRRFFRLVEVALKIYEKAPLRGLRRRALERARDWTLERLDKSDGLGAIFPPIVNSIYALRALGLEADDPLVASQVRELERLEIEESTTLRIQPCFSPVWDTALALDTLLDCGLAPDSAPARRAAAWLLDHEVRTPGDWSRKSVGGQVGGWYFEYANEFYPDCDDTAQVVTSLTKLRHPDQAEQGRIEAAILRGTGWLDGMQNRDGGWGAFDRDCDREVLTYIPLADHNAMIDPATVDVTARVVEAYLRSGRAPDSPELARALDFIRRQQESDGSWYGRWGCNYLYGTWLALCALRQAGEEPTTRPMRLAARWLEDCQNDDGGWGESPESYSDPESKGQGASTASQTGWALLGLMAAGEPESFAVRRGVD
ncbi:MAG: squalene--hopene cyclase, partial [Acidobacteria bacterium]|nr:squalene--hopene cyclase [Acidobacteriota bacterium]